MFKHSETVNFSKLFDYAFHSFPKTICESEFGSVETIPWRLNNRNVLADWFEDSVRILPAVKNGVAIPNFGKYLTYPFVGITGYSPHSGVRAKAGSESKFAKNAKKRQSLAVNNAIQNALDKNEYAVKGDAVIFMPNTNLGGDHYNTNRDDRKTTNSYRHISKDDYLLDQQVLSIDSDGNLFVDYNKKSGIILKKPQETAALCKLVKLNNDGAAFSYFCDWYYNDERYVNRIDARMSIFNNDIVRYINKPQNHITNYGNKNYFKFDNYFSEHGCGNVGEIDIDKAREHIRKLSDDEYIKGFIWKYWLESNINKTYIWTTAHIGQDYSKSDFLVSQALCNAHENRIDIGHIVTVDANNNSENNDENTSSSDHNADNISKDETTVSDIVNESASIVGLNNHGDIVADTFKKAVFDSMIYAANKPGGAANICITFLSNRDNTLMTVNDAVASQSKGLQRIFIKIDDVVESDPIDYTEIFKNDQFKDILDQSAMKKLIHREISGAVIGYPVDYDLEKIRRDEKENANEKNRHDSRSNDDFLYAYELSTGSKFNVNSSHFHISVVVPAGHTTEKGEYFLCSGYEKKSSQNPTTNSYELTDSLKQTIEKVMAKTGIRLESYFWYTTKADKDSNKTHIPSRGASAKIDAAGRVIK